MAVTNLRNRTHPGKIILAQDLMGTGSPQGDAAMADYPVGSTYINLTTAEIFVMRASGWSKTVAGS